MATGDFPATALENRADWGYTTKDNLSNTIKAATTFNIGATSLTLTSSTAFPAQGWILIDSEVCFYTANNTGTGVLTVPAASRALQGTTEANHSAGTTVYLCDSGGVINRMAVALEAVLAKIGINSSAVTTSLDYLSGNAWTAYTPTITGSSSNPTFTNKNGYYNVNGKLLTVFIESGPVTDNGSGYYSWSLPAGFTADTTVCKLSTIVDTDTGSYTLKMPLGTAQMSNYAAVWQGVAGIRVVLLTSTTVGLVVNSGTAARANGLGSADTLATVSAYVNLQFQVAIT